MIYGNHYCTNGTDFCGDWWEGMETGWGQVEMEMKSTRMSGDGCDFHTCAGIYFRNTSIHLQIISFIDSNRFAEKKQTKTNWTNYKTILTSLPQLIKQSI